MPKFLPSVVVSAATVDVVVVVATVDVVAIVVVAALVVSPLFTDVELLAENKKFF